MSLPMVLGSPRCKPAFLLALPLILLLPCEAVITPNVTFSVNLVEETEEGFKPKQAEFVQTVTEMWVLQQGDVEVLGMEPTTQSRHAHILAATAEPIKALKVDLVVLHKALSPNDYIEALADILIDGKEALKAKGFDVGAIHTYQATGTPYLWISGGKCDNTGHHEPIYELGPVVVKKQVKLMIFFFVVLAITVLIERNLNYIERRTVKMEKVVQRVYKEIMIMGILGFILVLFQSTGVVEKLGLDVQLFEFVHFVLFFMSIFFSFGAAFTVYWSKHHVRMSRRVREGEVRALRHNEPLKLSSWESVVFLLTLGYRRDKEDLTVHSNLEALGYHEHKEYKEAIKELHREETKRRTDTAAAAAAGTIVAIHIAFDIARHKLDLIAQRADLLQRVEGVIRAKYFHMWVQYRAQKMDCQSDEASSSDEGNLFEHIMKGNGEGRRALSEEEDSLEGELSPGSQLKKRMLQGQKERMKGMSQPSGIISPGRDRWEQSRISHVHPGQMASMQFDRFRHFDQQHESTYKPICWGHTSQKMSSGAPARQQGDQGVWEASYRPIHGMASRQLSGQDVKEVPMNARFLASRLHDLFSKSPNPSAISTHAKNPQYYSAYSNRFASYVSQGEMHFFDEEPGSTLLPNEPIHFYGSSSFRELSPQHPCDVELDGKRWGSLEHWYQAQKFVTTHPEHAEYIRRLPLPYLAHRAGNDRTGHAPRTDWLEVRDEIMWRGMEAKLAQNDLVLERLRQTEGHPLVYSDTKDPYWGIGKFPDGSPGKNMLGKMLEELRDIVGPEPESPRTIVLKKMEDEWLLGPWEHVAQLQPYHRREMSAAQTAAHPGVVLDQEFHEALEQLGAYTHDYDEEELVSFYEYMWERLLMTTGNMLEIHWQTWLIVAMVAVVVLLRITVLECGAMECSKLNINVAEWIFTVSYTLLLFVALILLRLKVFFAAYMKSLATKFELVGLNPNIKIKEYRPFKLIEILADNLVTKRLSKNKAWVTLDKLHRERPEEEDDLVEYTEKLHKAEAEWAEKVAPYAFLGPWNDFVDIVLIQSCCLLCCVHASVTLLGFSFRLAEILDSVALGVVYNIVAFIPTFVIYLVLLPRIVIYYTYLTSLGHRLSIKQLRDLTSRRLMELERLVKEEKDKIDLEEKRKAQEALRKRLDFTQRDVDSKDLASPINSNEPIYENGRLPVDSKDLGSPIDSTEPIYENGMLPYSPSCPETVPLEQYRTLNSPV